MKKGKVFGKRQVALAMLVAALGVAVWLNMKYSVGTKKTDSTENTVQTGSYLGEAQYVNGNESEEMCDAETEESKSDYFLTAQKDRQSARNDVIEQLEETVNDAKLSDEIKSAAVEKIAAVTARGESEANIESLLKAKGFEKTLAIIGDNDINIIVKSAELLESETVQIEDIATSQSGFPLDKVKIITIK